MPELVDYLTIVSGLPRSGTSMMMRMLEAGGIPVLTDEQRVANEDNPNGYYEFELAKRTKEDPSWLEGTSGKAVKMVYKLLYDLPSDREYRVLVMRRDMNEVLASQKVMLRRMGKKDDVQDKMMEKFFQIEIKKLNNWITQQARFRVMEVSYNQIVEAPQPIVSSIASFLDCPLDTEAMCRVVDNSLYRNRTTT